MNGGIGIRIPVTKKQIGRPLPDPVDDKPENIAKAILAPPPKREDEWEYLKESGA